MGDPFSLLPFHVFLLSLGAKWTFPDGSEARAALLLQVLLRWGQSRGHAVAAVGLSRPLPGSVLQPCLAATAHPVLRPMARGQMLSVDDTPLENWDSVVGVSGTDT